MAQNRELDQQTRPLTNPDRRMSRYGIPLRRRKLPMARLGGKKPPRAVMLVRMFRKIRLRWLKLKYLCMLKKLKESYKNMVKDLMEAGASIETFQQRIFMETTFAIPMGVSLSSYPSIPGSDRPRTLYI
ncbi:hypothetical protein ACLB2K_055149 [Fragaria x ananassa]|uniref:uncharacterized protein LOC105352328 n=1 Tax=Fragaria vesca subsp. vesca TaxID=101020 RepID=UPI0005C9FE10|nr:PREDICTED: uncharacterized protein LOC105352328 [Fragaria vesca subsp. vesca]